MRIFITIDTEVWPVSDGWPHIPLANGRRHDREVAAYLFGGSEEPRFGLGYQLRMLRDHGLKATFFVEPLFSFVLGVESLASATEQVLAHGQEIGLHLHPEWLADIKSAGAPPFAGPSLWQYDEATQQRLIAIGISRLEEVGVAGVQAFRAGSFAAGLSTLRALAKSGFALVTRLNPCYADSFPWMPERHRWTQPGRLEGVWEFPISHFVDSPPNGRRHMQVAACSAREFRAMLEAAEGAGWQDMVFVLHSFEFSRVDRLKGIAGRVTPRRLLAKRFGDLCGFLAANRERFETTHFASIDATAFVPSTRVAPITSNSLRTLLRKGEQVMSLLY
jgi:hypothetical protein